MLWGPDGMDSAMAITFTALGMKIYSFITAIAAGTFNPATDLLRWPCGAADHSGRDCGPLQGIAVDRKHHTQAA